VLGAGEGYVHLGAYVGAEQSVCVYFPVRVSS
jgi:hypothetical protein